MQDKTVYTPFTKVFSCLGCFLTSYYAFHFSFMKWQDLECISSNSFGVKNIDAKAKLVYQKGVAVVTLETRPLWKHWHRLWNFFTYSLTVSTFDPPLLCYEGLNTKVPRHL